MTDIDPTRAEAGARTPAATGVVRIRPRLLPPRPPGPVLAVGVAAGAVTLLAAAEIVTGLAGVPLHGLSSVGAGVGYGAEGSGPAAVEALWRTPEMMLSLTVISSLGLALIVASLAPRGGGQGSAPTGALPADARGRSGGDASDRTAPADGEASGSPVPHGATARSYDVGRAVGLSPRAARRGRARAAASARPAAPDAPTAPATRPARG